MVLSSYKYNEKYNRLKREASNDQDNEHDNSENSSNGSGRLSPIVPDNTFTSSSTNDNKSHSNSNSTLHNFADDDSRSDDFTDIEEDFIHISITPLECSITLPTYLIPIVFPNDILNKIGKSIGVEIINDEFLSLQINGDGLDGGKRVLELTSPLSNEKISIFFITTYFCDYVLIPVKEKQKVIKALENQSFIFSNSDFSNNYIGIQNKTDNNRYRHHHHHHHHHHRKSQQYGIRDTKTSNLTKELNGLSIGSDLVNHTSILDPKLELTTFDLFSKNDIKPIVEDKVELVLTGARSLYMSNNGNEDCLQLALVKILLQHPNFFSVTIINDSSEVSLLLEKKYIDCGDSSDDGYNNYNYNYPEELDASHNHLNNLTRSPSPFFTSPPISINKDLLMGSLTDTIIPIWFDLSELPIDCTGVVAGVANRLVGNSKGKTPSGRRFGSHLVHMSYLSTVKSGVVMIERENIDAALSALAIE